MATSPWEDSPTTIDERYETASSTSNLTVFGGMIPKDRSIGPGEVVVAAGLGVGLEPSARSTGMALLRLHTEWQSSAKPRRASLEQIAAVVRRLQREDDQAAGRWGPPSPQSQRPQAAILRARDEAAHWYVNELRLLANRLKSRMAVLNQLNAWAAKKSIEPNTVSAALFYWLDDSCHHCGGHGFERHHDQPSLSTKRCEVCRGAGKLAIPHGSGDVLRRIEYCLDQARGQLRERLARL